MDGVVAGLLKVGDGALAGEAGAAEGEGEDEAEEEDADSVIPIIEFKAPLIFAGEFLRVGPGTPAQHGDDAEKDCDG